MDEIIKVGAFTLILLLVGAKEACIAPAIMYLIGVMTSYEFPEQYAMVGFASVFFGTVVHWFIALTNPQLRGYK